MFCNWKNIGLQLKFNISCTKNAETAFVLLTSVFVLKIIIIDINISVYITPQTGANICEGGVNSGFINVLYQSKFIILVVLII